MTIVAKHALEEHTMTDAETRTFKVSFDKDLEPGEELTGTPTIVEVTTTDLTIDNKVVSSTELTISSATVASGRAVQFRVADGTAGETYKVSITCATDATPAQTVQGTLTLHVEG